MIYLLTKEVSERPKTDKSILTTTDVASSAKKQVSLIDEIDIGKYKNLIRNKRSFPISLFFIYSYIIIYG